MPGSVQGTRDRIENLCELQFSHVQDGNTVFVEYLARVVTMKAGL